MASYAQLVEVIKRVCEDVIKGNVPAGCTRAKLIKLSPLTFQLTNKLEVFGQFLVTPKYKIFLPEDIGKDYVFFKDAGGQTYYWMYEPVRPQGANGERLPLTDDRFRNEMAGGSE